MNLLVEDIFLDCGLSKPKGMDVLLLHKGDLIGPHLVMPVTSKEKCSFLIYQEVPERNSKVEELARSPSSKQKERKSFLLLLLAYFWPVCLQRLLLWPLVASIWPQPGTMTDTEVCASSILPAGH